MPIVARIHLPSNDKDAHLYNWNKAKLIAEIVEHSLKGQWDLAETLISSAQEKDIDLNARIIFHDRVSIKGRFGNTLNKLTGSTLAWLLIVLRKPELLEKIITKNTGTLSLELNAHPTKISRNRGITLAFLMVMNNYKKLFNTILSRIDKSIPIDVYADLYLNRDLTDKTLIVQLIKNGDIATLEYILEHHYPGIIDLNEKCHLLSNDSSLDLTLKELLQQANADSLIKKLEQRMIIAPNTNKSSPQEQKAEDTCLSFSKKGLQEVHPPKKTAKEKPDYLTNIFTIITFSRDERPLIENIAFRSNDRDDHLYTLNKAKLTSKVVEHVLNSNWDLAKTLISSAQEEDIDLNAQIKFRDLRLKTININKILVNCHGKDLKDFTGCSLAWLLIRLKKPELLEKIIAKNTGTLSLELNNHPFHHPICSTHSLAYLMIRNNYNELFNTILSRIDKSISINVFAGSLTDWRDDDTLIHELIKKRNITTLENILDHHYPGIIDLNQRAQLASLSSLSNPTLKELLQKANANNLIKKLEQRMALAPNTNQIPHQEPTAQNLASSSSPNRSKLPSVPMNPPPKERTAEEKRMFFSKKYLLSAPNHLKEIHRHQTKTREKTGSYSHRHQLISLANTLQISQRKKLTLQEELSNNDFLYCTALYYYAPLAKNLAQETVTFIFAGRNTNAYLPNVHSLGARQQCIVVLTAEEFKALNIDECPDSLGFLVIKRLAVDSHGTYENTGTIQARRLAAFFASFHWQIQDCIYLDDNIEWIGLNLLQPPQELLWSQVTDYLQQQRKSNHALIAGLFTYSNRNWNQKIQLDYCYKLFSMNFQQISTLLELHSVDDVFLLGYSASDANMCGEDYFFQVMIDIANSSNHRNPMNFLALPSIEHAGIQRNTNKGIAKNYIKNYADIEQISSQSYNLKLLKETHQIWITETLTRLKTQAKQSRVSFERRQHFEATRADLPQVLLDNALIKKRNAEDEAELQPNNKKTTPSEKTHQRKLTKTARQKDWVPSFTGLPLNQLMEDNTLALKTYLTTISHLCYDYQQEALNSIARTSREHGVLNIATGAGKTRVQILLANYLVANQINAPIHIVTATQRLVEQFYDAFQNTLVLLGEQASIAKDEVIFVQSSSGSIPWRNYLANKTLQQQTKIIIFCDDSYQLLQEELSQTTDTTYTQPALILLDEFHLYTSMAKKFFNSKATTLGFSATPPLELQPIYQFSRLDSLRAKITVPMIIDRLPYQLSNKNEKRELKINGLLGNHRHPRTGTRLVQTKGIIFVSSIAEADQLAEAINQSRPEPIAHAVHSNISNHAQLITRFQKKKFDEPGILIVVGMLQTGYDDKSLSWCIIARNNNENSATIHQIIGRVLRNNPADPKKIAYILTDQHLNLSGFGPLKDEEAITRANADYFKANKEIIYLDVLYAIQKKEPFSSYQPLFEHDCLKGHSLKKHLELVLQASKADWLAGLFNYDSHLAEEDLLACFANAAYGALSAPEQTGNQELYSAKKFAALLEALNQYLPHQLHSWISNPTCQDLMKKIKDKFAQPQYVTLLSHYKSKLTTLDSKNTIAPPLNAPQIAAHYYPSTSSHRLFASSSTSNETINNAYQYTDADVYRLLMLRLQTSQVPGLNILAAANMSDNYLGNRVADIVQQYLEGAYAPPHTMRRTEDLIIPIVYQNHWVGLRIQLRAGKPPKLTYYNSIKGYEPDTQLIPALLNEVNQVLGQFNLWPQAARIDSFKRTLEQNDATSCGAFLIENIYCDVKQKEWPITPELTQIIRARHLKLLKENDPDFYQGFYARQVQNTVSFQQEQDENMMSLC